MNRNQIRIRPEILNVARQILFLFYEVQNIDCLLFMVL